MQEHPAVTITKIGLLAVVAVVLILVFVAHNETQSKVIETADRVDEIGDQVAEVKRLIAKGVVARPADGTSPVAADDRAPRNPGWTVLLSPEPDWPRPPDDEIDFDAEFRWALTTEPKGLNLITSDRDANLALYLGHYVLSPLAERKNGNKDEYKPGLAERVEVSPDRTEFRIWLRQGVRWHRPALDLTDPKYAWMKGEHEVTTDDLKFALDMLRDTRADTANLRPEFDGIESYEVVDKHQFRVKYTKANFYAASALLTTLIPMPRWIYAHEEDGTPIEEASLGQRFGQHWFNKNMCGYGPYAFKEYKPSDYIRLERNEDYWGRRPAFKTVYYKLNLKDDEPRYNMYMRRDAQGRRDVFFYPISPTRWLREVIEGNGESPLLDPSQSYIYQYQRMMFAYTGWACRGKFFSDARVRRAMTLVANRPDWMEHTFNGIAVNPSGPIFVEAPEYDPAIAPWPYEPKEAARLLDEAGWRDEDGNGVREKTINGEKVEFRFSFLDQATGSAEIDAVTSNWIGELRNLGVIADAKPVEWNEWIKRARDRDFQAIFSAWSLEDDFRPLNTFHSRLIESPGSYNYVEWANPRADQIIDEIEVTFDLATRNKLCHEFHKIFHEEQPYTVTWSWKNPVAHDAHLGGIHHRVFQPQLDFKDAYWVKAGPAKYTDGRDKGKGWIRKKGD